MADRSRFSQSPHIARAALAAAGSAVLLSACAPATQSTTQRPAVQTEDELGSLMRVAAMTRDSGDADTAVVLYRRAHEVAPDNPQPLIEMARLLDSLGVPAEAALIWQDAARLAPNDPVLLGGYGLTLARLGQPESAQTYLVAATAVAPTVISWNALGVVRDQLGDAAGAQAAYRAGLAMAPNDLRLANNLGLSLALSGQTGEALTLLEGIVVRPDATIRHRQNLALTYALAGQDALAAQFGGVDYDPSDAQRNVMRYASIAALPDHASRVAAVSTLRSAQATVSQSASAQAAAMVKSRRQPAAEVAQTTPDDSRVTSVVAATRVAPAKAKSARKALPSVEPARIATPAPKPTPLAPPRDTKSAMADQPADAAPPALADMRKAAPAVELATTAVPSTTEMAAAAPASTTPASTTPASTTPTSTTPAMAPTVPEAAAGTPKDMAHLSDFPGAPHTYRPPFTPSADPIVAAIVTPQAGSASPDTEADVPAYADTGTDADVEIATSAYPLPDFDDEAAALADAPVADDVEAQGVRAEPAVAERDMEMVAEAPVHPETGMAAAAGPGAQTAGADSVEPADETVTAYPLALAGIELPSVDDRLIVAASAYHSGQFELAANVWEPLADAGIARAQFHLGALYYEGRGVVRDLNRAYMLLRKAELAGFDDSRIVLALIESKLPEADRERVEAQIAEARL